MHIGFIGLGNLGRAIAGRLLERGHALTVWNRTPGKEKGLPVEVAGTPAEAADKAEIVFLCLFDSEAVRQVLANEEGGLLAGNVSGKTIVDLTTNHFRQVLEFHELCRRAGAPYLEAPVLGSVVPASQGALTVLVSGEQDVFERTENALRDIGKHLFYLEQPSLASKMKLVNNLTLAGIMAVLAEATSFGEKVGIDKKDILDILAVGGGNSLVLNAKKNKLLEEDFSTHFSSALLVKDLHCLQDLAYDNGLALFTAGVTRELFARVCEAGSGGEDFSAIYKFFKNT
jgi:3-hydroxyisobutyrate dehydrogenase